MTLIVLVIIVAMFIGTVRAFRFSWPLALALLFLIPFIAINIVFICGLAREFFIGEFNNLSIRGMFSLTLMFYLFTFPYSLYPGGLCLALIGVMSRSGFRRLREVGSFRYNEYVLMATVCGGIVGVVFALFMSLISVGHSFSFALPITILTGAIDGLVIALFGQQKADPTNAPDAHGKQLSPA